MSQVDVENITVEALPKLLEADSKVKVAGIDADGILRGKVISKDKFLGVAADGFGFCSVLFGWDMHDRPYSKELKICVARKGCSDILARPDLSTFRRIPWEDNIPFFLVTFLDPVTVRPISACPRGLLKCTTDKLKSHGIRAMAGVEIEFSQFKLPSEIPGAQSKNVSIASFLRDHNINALEPLTDGMFGYSLTRTAQNKEYFYNIFDTCEKFRCGIESWHTESGPGVFEAALKFSEIQQMADKATLFKYLVKSIAIPYGITPCFMAKPKQGISGNSGHIHISLIDSNGNNLFAREARDEGAKYQDISYLSDIGRQFLAGILDGLTDIMPMLAPNINSYKRLVENFWAPVTVSWGLEHRAASVRIIAPPTSKSGATRIEVRVPGADINPSYALAAILALGWRGVEKKLEISLPPLQTGLNVGETSDSRTRLSKSLREATENFMRSESIAREVFGNDFVEHYGGTRENEYRLWDEAVTDWETQRYIETV
ncbi:BgTH12-05315 [Blumeria graminis f. sp. triticale]|uniref:Glutamine synthetase n=3 Tax=Blumeria graminis TaxID=34373 RepID=A0A061HEW7_BLUGR|nr:Glutamine synthetase [Blumeria graminis f. sp. tritici 96224]CAD6502725.1 BgTH12-05315 [Blumeria graminis f. sp. triticale]VDB88166.1 Bgt-681 [Blumeria graminis f. sp. tritici]